MESRKPGSKDYYAVLGVSPESTPSEIKKVYRALARRYHPDRVESETDTQAAGERMVEINEAFAVLSDAKRRAAHDRELASEKIPTPPPQEPPEDWKTLFTTAKTPTPAKGPRRNVPVDETVAREFLDKMKAQVLQEGAAAKLREESEKNWLWSLLGKTWGGNYWISVRLVFRLNPSTARETIVQLQTLMEKRRSGWKSNFFIFILAFQSLSEGETVLKLCRAFCHRAENSTPKNLVHIVVLDLNLRRSVLCGKRTGDSPLNSILRALAAS